MTIGCLIFNSALVMEKTMNYFDKVTVGFDKITQDNCDLWDAAIDSVMDHVNIVIIGWEEDEVDYDKEEILAEINECRSDGKIDIL